MKAVDRGNKLIFVFTPLGYVEKKNNFLLPYLILLEPFKPLKAKLEDIDGLSGIPLEAKIIKLIHFFLLKSSTLNFKDSLTLSVCLTMGLMQRVVKPRNQRSKRALLKREPKAIENDKSTIFVRGQKCSETVKDCMKDFHSLKRPDSIMVRKLLDHVNKKC